MHRIAVLLAVLAALAAAGCGSGEPGATVERDVQAVTAPDTPFPYEAGGADGSGADGRDETERRGGIAAGTDDPDPAGARGEGLGNVRPDVVGERER